MLILLVVLLVASHCMLLYLEDPPLVCHFSDLTPTFLNQ